MWDVITYQCLNFILYGDVIMGAIASQITSLTIVYSTVYSDADQRNIKAPRYWPLCGEFTGDQWIPRTNGQSRGKCFHLMTSSWSAVWATMKTTARAYTSHKSTENLWHNPNKTNQASLLPAWINFSPNMHDRNNYTPHFIIDVVTYSCCIKVNLCW